MPPLNPFTKTALTVALSQAVILPSNAATIIVDTSADTLGFDECTLRAAIISANTDTPVDSCASGSGDDIILFNGVSSVTLSEQLPTVNSTITINGEANNIIIDGDYDTQILRVDSADLTLLNATLARGYSEYGGAILASDSTISINNSSLINNRAFSNSDSNASGGAISASSSTISINNSYLYFNNAYSVSVDTNSFASGGAISASSSTITISNSRINRNNAFSVSLGVGGTSNATGGAISLTNSILTIDASEIHDNDTAKKGGAIATSNSTTTINNSTFRANSTTDAYSASDGGGAISVEGSSVIAVNNSYFFNNISARDGGAINNIGGSFLTLNNVEVSSNTAVRFGGGIYSDAQSTITNTTISSNNAANKGGGVFINNGGHADILNTTIANNTSANSGGGLTVYVNSTAKVTNTIISGNSAESSIGHETYVEDISTTQFAKTNLLGDNNKDSSSSFYGGTPSTANNIIATPVSYTHLTLPTTPYV